MKPLKMVALVLFALVLLACGEVPTAAPGGQVAAPTPQKAVVSPTETVAPKPAWPAEAQPLADLAVTDLISRTQAPTATVVSVEAVQWRNGCLECARAGEMCTEAIVPGYRIILQVGEQQHEYRTDKRQLVRLCPAGSVWDATAQPLVDKALADLAGRLGIAQDTIKVVSVEPMMWRDSSIGCPKEGEAYLTVIVPGYKIVLEAGGKTYNYHAGDRGEVFWCETSTQ
jgi:hypothetical protein